MLKIVDLPVLIQLMSKFNGVKKYLVNKFAVLITGTKCNIDWGTLKVRNRGKLRIGKNFSAGRFLWLETLTNASQLSIGDNVNLSDLVHIGCLGDIVIGDGVLMGSSVLIIDHSHGVIPKVDIEFRSVCPPNLRPLHYLGQIVIEENVWIGDKVSIIGNVRIGRNSIVGAGSVVLDDIPPNTVWAGSPAKQIRPVIN